MSNHTSQKQTFNQFVLNTLSAADFNNLPAYLGLSARKTTMRLAKPELIDETTAKKLAKILNVTALKLIQEFDLGYDAITIRGYQNLLNEL